MITTVLGVKGGVGKSTVAMNVAIWMSKRARVLLLDGDPRVRSVELKLRPRGRGSLFEVLSGKISWEEAVHPCSRAGLPNLFVMPAGRVYLPPAEKWEERLKFAARLMDRMLEGIRGKFEHVVIDTPPSIGYEHLLLTSMAERILYVCEPNEDSIASTKAASTDLVRICEIEPAGVVLSKVVDKGDLKKWKRMASEIAPLLGVIPFDEAAERAFRRNMPLALEAPNSKASLALRKVAAKLLRMEGRPASVERRICLMLERLPTEY